MSRFGKILISTLEMLYMAKQKHISLKEAAAISGYSPDYIGQLIRAGKLPGEQVFLNVAWVTTESAVRDYIESSKKGSTTNTAFITWKNKVFSPEDLETIYKVVLGGAITLAGIFVLFLGYVLSVTVDHHISQSYERQIELNI